MNKMLHDNKTMRKWNKPDFIPLEFGELKFGKLKGHRGMGPLKYTVPCSLSLTCILANIAQ